MNCRLTPARVRWLKHLVTQRHETPWDEMPRRETPWDKMPRREDSLQRDLGGMTSQTWRPMKKAGLITARYGQRHFSEASDWQFAITEIGRIALVRYQSAETTKS